MQIIYSILGLSLVGGVFGGYSLDKVTEHAMRRKLQQGTSMLCGTSGSSSSQTILPYCATGSQTMSVVDWNPCCTFDGEFENQMCRALTTDGEYCNPATDPQGCNQLGEEDVLKLDLEFKTIPEDEKCCKSCICYGDPECISFDGKEDLWIPCDGRNPGNCRVQRNFCEKLTGPNGETCMWTRTDRDDSKNWNFPMNGSPCLPDLTQPITMNMYHFEEGSNNFDVTLNLGERGVISAATFTLNGSPYTINAQTCFDEENEASWVNGVAPPGAVSYATDRETQVGWYFFHAATRTYVKFFCVRAVSEDRVGVPRINIQEVTVDTNQVGSGFCQTGVIDGRTGDYADSNDLHRNCVQNIPDSMQACKHLVNYAYTYRELQTCANEYCALADLDTASCEAALGEGTNNDAWITQYCTAIQNNGELPQGTSLSACKAMVQEEGYTYAVDTWGKGLPKESGGSSCASSITEYDISKRMSCTDGVYIEVLENGAWVAKYFVPADKPPCGGTLLVSAAEAKVLFTTSIRIRQCDVRGEENCSNVDTCDDTVGAVFQLTYTNPTRQLVDMWESGVLQCVPNASGSTTWCLPTGGSSGGVELCPCPEDSRRVLLGN